MIVFKTDTQRWTVRPVEGGSFPARDADGDTCYDNTHFKREADAWDKLEREVEALVAIVGRQVVSCREQLSSAERAAADAVVALGVVREGRAASAFPNPARS